MEQENHFVLYTDNFLPEEEMEEAFKDFDFGKELIASLEELVAFQEGRPNGCRVTVVESPEFPIQSYEGEDITKAREELKLSPQRFAYVLGVTPETVELWESGKAVPDGTACNLLYLLKCKPSLVDKF